MSTKAVIALKTKKTILGFHQKKNLYISSRHHFDGYPELLGRNLNNYWIETKKVKKAIKLGDASFWGKDVGFKKSFNCNDEKTNLYYHRDRGDRWKNCRYMTSSSLYELKKKCIDYGAIYFYLMKDGEWFFQEVEKWAKDIPPVPLISVLT